jgi:predicted nuclease of predicted toxin-antitoxin system
VRLLLDEHFSPQIARELRERGHDVSAVQELPELRSLADHALLAHAVDDRRTLLTNNVSDFVIVARRWAEEGRDHYGLLFTSDASMPRTREGIGRFVEALQRLMEAHPGRDDLMNRILWPKP